MCSSVGNTDRGRPGPDCGPREMGQRESREVQERLPGKHQHGKLCRQTYNVRSSVAKHLQDTHASS